MPFGGFRAEPRLNARQELRGQRDFGQQHQRLTVLAQRLGHGLKVNLGLARSGDAAQQGGAIGAGGNAGLQGRGAGGLIFGQILAGMGRIQPAKRHIAGRVLFGHRALRHQPLDHRSTCAGLIRQFFERENLIALRLQHLQHPRARLGHSRGRRMSQTKDLARRGRIAQPRRACGQPQHRGQRRQRVVGSARQKHLHFLAHRRDVQHANDATRLFQIEPANARPPDHTQHLARPQRHLDERAGMAPTFGCAIVQRPTQRLRSQHTDQHAFVVEFRRVGHEKASPGKGFVAALPMG